MAWTGDVRIPGQQSKAPPALAYGGSVGAQLHMVHLGDGSNDIWHSRSDGETWFRPDTGEPGNSRIPGQQSKASPALAYYGGLHMVHLGDGSNDIWHSYFDGQTWRRPDTGEPGNSPILGQQSKAAPAIFTNNGLLHMVHLGDSSNDIWHSTFDKTGWSPNVRIPGQQSKASPALTEYSGLLHMVHLGDSSNDIRHSTFNGNNWSTDPPIPGHQSKVSPALALYNTRLHMVHLGDSSNDIWHSTSDGRS